MEFNSFFNRFNLILKFHDHKKVGVLFNVSNILNILTMIFVRFYCIVLMLYYLYINFELVKSVYLVYTSVIMMCLVAMTYLACQSFKYMVFNDFVYVRSFLFGASSTKNSKVA